MEVAVLNSNLSVKDFILGIVCLSVTAMGRSHRFKIFNLIICVYKKVFICFGEESFRRPMTKKKAMGLLH